MHYDMFKDIKVKEYVENPILDCLAIFCKMSGRPYSKESLISGLPIEEGHSSPVLFSKFSSKSLFSRAAAKAGFKTRVLKTKIEDINPLVLPCIVLLNGKNPKDELRACILLGFDDEMANARVVLPEAEDVENSVTIEELKKYGREDIMVIVGGVIPAQDYQFLFDAGAVAVFGPGTKISEAAITILEVLLEE